MIYQSIRMIIINKWKVNWIADNAKSYERSIMRDHFTLPWAPCTPLRHFVIFICVIKCFLHFFIKRFMFIVLIISINTQKQYRFVCMISFQLHFVQLIMILSPRYFIFVTEYLTIERRKRFYDGHHTSATVSLMPLVY